MNVKFLPKMNFISLSKMFALLIMMIVFIAGSPTLRGQHINCDPTPKYEQENDQLLYCCPMEFPHTFTVGTECSRIAATVTVLDDGNVRFDVIGVGALSFEFLEFGIFYDDAKYDLCDAGFNQSIEHGCNGPQCWHWSNNIMDAITIYDDITLTNHSGANPADFAPSGSTHHRQSGRPLSGMQGGYTYLDGMAAFTAFIGVTIPYYEDYFENKDQGTIVPLFSFYLKNITGNPKYKLDLANDIGFGVNDLGTLGFTVSWGYGAKEIAYAEIQRSTWVVDGEVGIEPNWFYFRSEAGVETVDTIACDGQTVLEGKITRPYSPMGGILDYHTLVGPQEDVSYTEKNGELDYDRIIKYGFIYTEDPLAVGKDWNIDMFSNDLKNGGTPITPTINLSTLLNSGTGTFPVTIDGINCMVVIVDDENPVSRDTTYNSPSIAMTNDIYVWSFATYYFQTSQEYALLGNKVKIVYSDAPCQEACDLTINSVYVVSQSTCTGTGGEIQINVTGGKSPYTYGINAPGSTPLDSGLIGGLAPGTYYIYVQDDSECDPVMSGAITIEATDANFSFSVTTTDASSCGASGSITLTINGSGAAYQYRLDDGSWVAVSGPILATTGIHIIEVRDLATPTCILSSGEIFVGVGGTGGLTVNATSPTGATCESPTGEITLTVSGGSGDYSYRIGDMPMTAMPLGGTVTVEDYAAGTYNWRVIDNITGCYDEDFVKVFNSDKPTFEVELKSVIDAKCDGTGGGMITVTVKNGTPQYKLTIDGWKTSPAATLSAAGDYTFTDLAVGLYDVLVEDNDGCTYVYKNIEVERGVSPTVVINHAFVSSHTTCNDQNGSIEIHISGGTAPYQYSTDGVNYNGSLSAGSNTIPNLGTGTYYIYIKDSSP
ncbi:MAG: SprB repeat-containing protein, partial [Bacteroidales bacterium]|nr:SprB repeat-containing protein [Bacteroidales bacterium]